MKKEAGFAGAVIRIAVGAGGSVGRSKLTDTAVVGALRTGETALWPLIWFVIDIEESVLLFETEPWLDVPSLVHDLLGVVAVVGPVRCSIVVVRLCEDKNVFPTAERILENRSGAKVDVGVVAGSLVGGRAVKVPNAEIANIVDSLGDSL